MIVDSAAIRIGLIADTHGLLRDEAVAALQGCAAIIHAGDIGKLEILTRLARLAPVTAVRGNNDRGHWAESLSAHGDLCIGTLRLHVLHDVADLSLETVADATVVISGHSHRPQIETRDGVLFVNPGSAGPRRFRLPVSIALLDVDANDVIAARIVELAV